MRIELKEIHKYYGSVKANRGISLTFEPGTIHGLLGENGAGKSTLMKILAGFTQKSSGEILLNGTHVYYQTPADASKLGIGMLYQDPLDFPVLSILENYLMGQRHGMVLKTDEARKEIASVANHLKFSLLPHRSVKSLTTGERQQLEIVRLLSIGVQVLILDEPTTGISGIQKEILFEALRKLASEGKSIILASHKIEDIESLCDRVTVLRQGVITGQMEKPFDTDLLLKMVFGIVPEPPSAFQVHYGEPLMTMLGVSASGGRTGLKNCNVTIAEGEIVGLAGSEGSGQELFLRVSAGLKTPTSGSIYYRGKKMNGADYHERKKFGVTFLPTARLEEGLIPGLTILEHFALLNPAGVVVEWKEAEQRANAQIETFRIKGTPGLTVESLSGGNQQRLLLSLLPEDPLLLLLEKPTRGLDLESVHWVWNHLHRCCHKKTSLIFSSSDLDEILQVATRILVFYEGSIIMDVKTSETNRYELARAISGKR
ncbi:MAG: ATP-binding cassette domain-containing protein [Pseudomonadota bacterium]